MKAHSDWLLKLAIDFKISFVIDLQATCAGFVLKKVVIVCCWNKIIFLCYIITLFSKY